MSHELNELSRIETANIAAMTVLTAFWFACLGASFGSFLNVVVYRLPRGRSLWREPSRCPACETRIAWSDNLPILGWLRLRGRCRTCGWSIPLRYPLVEATVAADFLFLLFVELLSGGANLPVRSVNMYAGVVWMVWYAMAPDLLAIYAYHLCLLYTALALVLWEIDEQPVPRSWGIGAIGLGVIATTVMPELHPLLTNMEYRPAVTLLDRFEAVGDAAAGAVAGCLCAIALSQFLGDRRSARGMVWMGLLAGTYLGFNGALLWAAWWLLLSVVLAPAFRHRPGSGLMLAATAALHVQLATWRPIWRMVEGIQAG